MEESAVDPGIAQAKPPGAALVGGTAATVHAHHRTRPGFSRWLNLLRTATPACV